jgi:uncharacterized integral membrane protein
MPRRSQRDPANDREVARQGNVVFWMSLVAALIIVVLLIILVAR